MAEEKYSRISPSTLHTRQNHYTVKGTPEEVVARISTAFEGLPAQFKYENSSFEFDFYTPEKSQGYIHCFTKSDGEHVIEIMRISGQQVYFYPVFYQLLFRMGLGPEPEPQPEFKECLFQPPIKESHMSHSCPATTNIYAPHVLLNSTALLWGILHWLMNWSLTVWWR